MKIDLKCFSCNETLIFNDRVGLRETCSKCHADVHVCRNCTHYDPKVYNECKEPTAEVVRERDRANYCDFFKAGTASGGQDQRANLLSAAESLFKKK